MRIKKDFLLCFFLVIAVMLFGLLSPASADFKKVNEHELARTNASLTGQPGTIVCPDNEESDCFAIPAGGEFAGDSLSSLHDDYGYDWWKNLKVAGEPFYEEPVYSPISTETGTISDHDTTTIYMRLGLGSQEVGFDSRDFNIAAKGCCSENDTSSCQGQSFGSLHLDGLKVKTDKSSYVTMSITRGVSRIGVKLDDVRIDYIKLATLSWGDADGIQDNIKDANNAGYVGLKDTSINDVTAYGSLSIGVAKSQGVNSVNIAIDNLNVGMASLDTTVVLGDKKDFSGAKYVLGSLYMKDLKVTNVNGQLDIYNSGGVYRATGFSFGNLKVPSLTLDTLSWGDPDGFDGASEAGYIGLRHLDIKNLVIVGGGVTFENACVQAGDTGTNLPAGTAFVRLGFNKLNITMEELNTDVALGNRKDNLTQVLGSLYLGGLNMNINGSVDIHPPSVSTQGIVFGLNITPSDLYIAALSWGNADGFGGTTTASTAGYVGLRNLAIVGLTIAGNVSINAATATNNTYNMSPTFVHIGLGTGNSNNDPALPGALAIGMKSLAADVVLDKTKTLNSDSSGTLGSIYISEVSYRVNGWVDIGAH
jgi:hypothetical protein